MSQKFSGSFSESVSNGSIENTWFEGAGSEGRINLSGNSTLRNVAVTNAKNHPAPVHVSGDGQVLLENVFIRGVNDNCIFVNEKFGGTLTLRNCYLGDAVEDAVYGSPAGNPDYKSGKAPGGHQGVVNIENSMAENCGDYGFRLGSHNSSVKDSVVKNCGTALANLYGNPVTFENCDVQGNKIGIKHIDHDDRNVGNWPEEVRTVLRNVRVESPDVIRKFQTAAGGGTIEGSPDPNPDLSVPYKVPRSPDQAINGVPEKHLIIDGSNVSAKVDYRLVGHASKVEAGKDANVGDGETQIDVRTWEGMVNGGADDYYVFSSDAPHITELVLKGAKADLEAIQVTLDGEDVKSEATLEETAQEPEPTDPLADVKQTLSNMGYSTKEVTAGSDNLVVIYKE